MSNSPSQRQEESNILTGPKYPHYWYKKLSGLIWNEDVSNLFSDDIDITKLLELYKTEKKINWNQWKYWINDNIIMQSVAFEIWIWERLDVPTKNQLQKLLNKYSEEILDQNVTNNINQVKLEVWSKLKTPSE